MPFIYKDRTFQCDRCHDFFYIPDGKGSPKPEHFFESTMPDDYITHRKGRTYCDACRSRYKYGAFPHLKRGEIPQNVASSQQHVTMISLSIHNYGNQNLRHRSVVLEANVAFSNQPTLLNEFIPLIPIEPRNALQHPAYPGGTMRCPGKWSGTNLGQHALCKWSDEWLKRPHIHVGKGGLNRVSIGWRVENHHAMDDGKQMIDRITIYVGS